MVGVWFKSYFFKGIIIIYEYIIMTKWYNTFDGVFWITITTLLTGSIGLALRYCLRSKCQKFNCCWGILNIERNIEEEVKEEMKELEMGRNSPNRNNINLNTREDS